MAGSYNHCVDEDDRFLGVRYLDNLGDAYEALEEMYGMIWYLASQHSGGSAQIERQLVEEARQRYRTGLELSPGIVFEDE